MDKRWKNARIWFGKHEGERFSELPDSYLDWLENNSYRIIEYVFHAKKIKAENR